MRLLMSPWLQVASVIDFPPLGFLPHCLLQQKVRHWCAPAAGATALRCLSCSTAHPSSGNRVRMYRLDQQHPPSEPHHLQVLKPMRYMVGGTMLVSPDRASALPIAIRSPRDGHSCLRCNLRHPSVASTLIREPPVQAVALALEHGWSINIGGGMHHACFEARRHACRAPVERLRSRSSCSFNLRPGTRL